MPAFTSGIEQDMGKKKINGQKYLSIAVVDVPIEPQLAR